MTDREVMQMALEDLETWNEDHNFEGTEATCAALRTALAQPEPEPWGYILHKLWKMPVFVEVYDLQAANIPHNDPNYTPVYKAPPKKEWVGLTDEDKKAIYEQDIEGWQDYSLIEAVEAKLKDKNR